MENIYNAIQNVYNMDKTTWQEVIAELYNLVSNVENKFDLFEIKFGSLLGEQVTRELKKMYDDGSLASLINDKLLKDINTKVDTFKTEVSEQLDTIANNSRIINATFGVAPWWLGDTPEWKIEQDILKNKKIGCEEMYLVIHMDYENGKFVTRELIEKQLYALEICKTNGIDVKILKFHTDEGMRDIFPTKKTEWVEYYKSEVNRWIEAFKNEGIEYVTILNEFPIVYSDTSHDDVVQTLANVIKSKGFKLGITTVGILESLQLTQNNKELIDAYFVNLYPVISYNMKNSTLAEAINSWNIYEPYVIEICKSNKPFFISETGCQDRWEALANPAMWHWQTTYNEPSKGYAPSLIIEGLFKSNIINYCEKVFYWYFDSLWFDIVGKTIKKYIGGDN